MNDWLLPNWGGFNKKPTRPPDQVGAKRIKTLKVLRQSDKPWSLAEAQFAGLYRMGYVRREGDTAQITNAGLSVLDRHERKAWSAA